MKKILWISDYSSSGYTLVTNCLLKHIIDIYDVYLLVINTPQTRETLVKRINSDIGIANDHIFSAPVIDKIDEYNTNVLVGILNIPDILKNINPDVIFSINDLQILNRQIKCIKTCTFWNGITIAYTPIDAENYPEYFFNILRKFNHVITMNDASKKVLLKSKFYNHIYVLNHPIKDTFYQIEDKSSPRRIFGDKVNDDSILIFNANVNDKRKRLDLTIESFYMLYDKHSDNPQLQTKNVYLIFKTDTGGYFNMIKIIDDFDIKYNINLKNNIIFVTNQFTYEQLNQIYNCADLYITTTSGEGWGLTAFEFLKLNVYTLVPNNMPYREFFNKELLYNTDLKPISQGRYMQEELSGNILWCLLRGVKSFDFKITRDEFISIDSGDRLLPKFIISPDTDNFQSFNSVITKLEELGRSNRLPDKFLIFIKVDSAINCNFYKKIMTEIYHYDFNKLKYFTPLHNIYCVDYDSLDSSIVQVQIPVLDDLVDKMFYYITNKEQCDEDIKVYSANILKDLSNEKVGDTFKNILQDIIME